MRIIKMARAVLACAVLFLTVPALSADDFESKLEGLIPKNAGFSAAVFMEKFTLLTEGKKEAEFCKEEFAEISHLMKERVRGEKGDLEKLKALSAFSYGEIGFRFDPEANAAAARRAVNSFYRETVNYESWPQLLSEKEGICAGLSALYMALAEEAGIELYPVFAPGHVYLRYEKNNVRVNIETTLAGRFMEDAYYAKKSQSAGSNCYTKTMPREAISSALFSNLGSHYDAKGRYAEALILHEKSVKLNPDLPEARANLSAAYLKAGRHAEAEKEAVEALRLYPGHAGAAANLAAVYQKTKRHAAAGAIFEKIIKKEPNNSQAFDGLGISAREAGDLKKAEACFRRAVELDPANEKAVNNLGNIYMLRGRYDDAVEAYKKSILLNPHRHESRMNLASAYYSAGRYSASASEYERAVILNPEGYFLYCNMGAAYQRLGRSRDAEKAFKQALAIKPDDALSLFNLGALYLEMERPEEAVVCFEKVLKNDPDNKEALYNLGAGHEIMGNAEKAEYYKKKSGL